MVRFIMKNISKVWKYRKKIYIPIWLDLLSYFLHIFGYNQKHLHSNMVRFIIERITTMFTKSQNIYIPIWLDLLYFTNSLSAEM